MQLSHFTEITVYSNAHKFDRITAMLSEKLKTQINNSGLFFTLL